MNTHQARAFGKKIESCDFWVWGFHRCYKARGDGEVVRQDHQRVGKFPDTLTD